MAIELKLEAFNGPLDLLLHLIEKNKVSIYDIPIALITQQYMEYIDAMTQKNLQMDVMSEFLVMAATLLDIKSRMLLPAEKDEEGEEIDPREELVAQLLEYKMYKYMSYELRDRMEEASRRLYKPDTTPKEVLSFRPEIDPAELTADLTLQKLHAVFDSVLRRQTDKIDPIRSRFGTIEKEEVSMEDKLLEVADYAKKRKRFSFRELLTKQKSRMQTIVAFLAMLELMKYGIIEASQEETAGDILIRAVPGADLSGVNIESDFGNG